MKPVAALLAALLVSACTDGTEEYFVIDYEDQTLGAGLDYTFLPMRIICGRRQQFPYACHQRTGSIDEISTTGAGELRATSASRFTLHGREPGTALVDLSVTVNDDDGIVQLADTFDVPVLPIAYSQLGWYSSDAITEPTGAAFRSSTVSVWQHHYREPRERLVHALTSDIVAAELAGDAPFELDRAATQAALVAEPGLHIAADVTTGDAVGTATVRTTAGGAFSLDVVDASAIAWLDIDRDESGALGALVLRPYDATNRPILGCPATAATATDSAGAVVVTGVDTTPWASLCRVKLDWKHNPVDTTVVVRWGTQQASISIDVAN